MQLVLKYLRSWMRSPRAWLSPAADRLRYQINAAFPDRDKQSDGWLGDARHALRTSQHNPDPTTGVVRAIDVDAHLLKGSPNLNLAFDLADQLRLAGKNDKSKRIAYVIFHGRICSPKSLWRWVKYRGINPHNHHIHISFTKTGDNNPTSFEIPILKG